MAETNSIAFPNMFNVAQNQVAVLDDNVAITNRVRLLLLTDPTELYNSPQFGTGLRKYLFQYNNKNTIARLQDTVREKIRQYEPYVDADNIEYADGLVYTGKDDGGLESQKQHNELAMTIKLETKFGDSITVSTKGV